MVDLAQGENAEERLNLNPDGLAVDQVPGEELGELGFPPSSSSGDESECGPQKLSRAQRKRLRKKKLRDDVRRRGGIIGPLLPPAPDPPGSSGEDGKYDLRHNVEGVRQNAAERPSIVNNEPGEPAPCANQSKVKHRRRVKKMAVEKSNPAIAEKSGQGHGQSSKVGD